MEGTQPTFTQVPPITPRSIKVTVAPSSAALSAAAIAPPPLPITATRSDVAPEVAPPVTQESQVTSVSFGTSAVLSTRPYLTVDG